MLNFIQWLNETYSFKNSNDVDFTADSNQIIFMSVKDKRQYIEQNKTHGNISHAIKHYGEFNEQKYKNIAKKIKNKLKELIKDGTITYLELYEKGGESIKDIEKIIEKANWRAYLNTLDLINDKREEGTPLSKEERELLPIMDELSDSYMTIINNVTKQAKNIDNIKNKENLISAIEKANIIKLSAVDRMGYRVYFLDLKRNIFIIADDKVIYSCFEFSTNAKSYKDVIKNFCSKNSL